jgi:hypothetical protein
MPQPLADHPVLSNEAVYLWSYFLELHRSRGSNGFGSNPISYGEIADWVRLTGKTLASWEVKAITKADTAYLIVQNEHAANKAKQT